MSDPQKETTTTRRRARPCPICGALSLAAFHPFCSARCADVDLHRWLSGAYAIPVVESEPDEDDEDRT